jgi:hypothetical protein
MDSINNLKNTRTYLVGAMDRVSDGGIGWRQTITPILKNMNVMVLDPCHKPINGVKEDFNTRSKIEEYKKSGQFHRIKAEYSVIRNADLRCVDISDFIIAQIDMDVHACGSYEEIVTANRQKKPVLVWCKQGKSEAPNWLFFMLPHEHIFSSMEEVIDYLQSINQCKDTSSLKRWFFLET